MGTANAFRCEVKARQLRRKKRRQARALKKLYRETGDERYYSTMIVNDDDSSSDGFELADHVDTPDQVVERWGLIHDGYRDSDDDRPYCSGNCEII